MTRIRFVILFVITTLAAPSLSLAQAPVAGKRYALLVGVNEYNSAKLRKLDYAEKDVEAMAALLRENGYTVTLLRGKDATREKIGKALEAITKAKGKDDLLIFGLAGHGVLLDKKGSCFCPHDADFTDPATFLSMTDMLDRLGDCGAGAKLLLVDACREDAKRGIRGIDQIPQVPPGVGVLLSCSAGEFSFETKKLEHGVFFHHVLEGLRGKAKTEDNDVTWDQLRAYVKRRVPKDVETLIGGGGKQVPHEIGNLTTVPALLQLAAEEFRGAIAVKLKERVLDKTILVTKNAVTERKIAAMDDKGQVLTDSVSSLKGHVEYKETMLKRDPGNRPTTLVCEYVKAQHGTKDQLQDSSLQGKTVVIEKTGEAYRVTYKDGNPVDAPSLATLNNAFGNKGAVYAELEKNVLPNRPVKVGEGWKVETAKVAKELAKDEFQNVLEFDLAKSTGEATLVRAYSKDGRRFAEIRVKMEIPVVAIVGAGERFKFDGGAKIVLDLSFDACVDGTSRAKMLKIRTVMTAKSSNPDRTASFTVNETHDSTEVHQEIGEK